jgi:hypothetical protein
MEKNENPESFKRNSSAVYKQLLALNGMIDNPSKYDFYH